MVASSESELGWDAQLWFDHRLGSPSCIGHDPLRMTARFDHVSLPFDTNVYQDYVFQIVTHRQANPDFSLSTVSRHSYEAFKKSTAGYYSVIQEVRGGRSSFKRSEMGSSSTIDTTNFPTSRAGSFEGGSRLIQPKRCSHDGVFIGCAAGGVPRRRAPSSCAHGYGLF